MQFMLCRVLIMVCLKLDTNSCCELGDLWKDAQAFMQMCIHPLSSKLTSLAACQWSSLFLYSSCRLVLDACCVSRMSGLDEARAVGL